MRALVVEDERTTRTLLTRLLRARGWEVVSCVTAEEGWRLFLRERFPLVLLNWMLPGMSGLEMCERLRRDERGRDAIILVITGRSEPGALERVLEAGADDYLAKPFEVGTLHVRLRVAERRVEDVRARREVERERAEIEERMRHRQRLESLGVMAGAVAHDFNNLLAGMLGQAHLAMAEAAPGSEVHERLIKLQGLARTASDLTGQLLAYSGRGHLTFAPLDLNELPPHMYALLEVSKGKGVDLAFRLADAPLTVRADRAGLQQVLINLVTNASDAVGEEAGVITVSTGVVDVVGGEEGWLPVTGDPAPGEYAFIEVADTGCGMHVETQARMFDPFFTTKTGGRGLGLAAAVGIVRSHGGVMRVQSTPGQGTTVRVLLPLMSGEADVPFASPIRPVGQLDWRGSAVVLIVELDAHGPIGLGHAVNRHGFQAITVRGVEEALEVLERPGPRVSAVLLAGAAQRMEWRSAARRVAATSPDTPMLLCPDQPTKEPVTAPDWSGPPVRVLEPPLTAAAIGSSLRSILAAAGAD